MSVTFDATHEDMFLLKVVARLNTCDIFFYIWCVPRRQILVEGCCMIKHVCHVFNIWCISRRHVLVESFCNAKHESHILCIRNIPQTNVLIERSLILKNSWEILKIRHIPFANRPSICCCCFLCIGNAALCMRLNSFLWLFVCSKGFAFDAFSLMVAAHDLLHLELTVFFLNQDWNIKKAEHFSYQIFIVT